MLKQIFGGRSNTGNVTLIYPNGYIADQYIYKIMHRKNTFDQKHKTRDCKNC